MVIYQIEHSKSRKNIEKGGLGVKELGDISDIEFKKLYKRLIKQS
jgi:hypothetical protein